MKKLLVVGAGGHASVVIDAARTSGAWSVVSIVDDNADVWGSTIEGVVVAERTENWSAWIGRVDAIVVAVGNNRLREEIQCAAMKSGIAGAVVIHLTATVAASASLGAGTVVMAGAVVNPNARIGRGVIVNTGATVDHDCDIGDWTHIAPGVALCGEVHVGESTLLGVGAKAIPGVRIGKRCIVGAGAVVTRDLKDDSKVVGIPARPLDS